MQSNRLTIVVILLAVCLTQFASDIYTPSLPAIATGLNAHINLVQWSMSIYMLGVALTQIIYGIYSEAHGRKSPMVIGIVIMTLGSVICMFAPNIEILILGRFIQGCGAGACAALWRSIFRDIYTGEQLAKIGSYLTVFVMFIVPAAPALGGYLQHYFGWRASFVFMAFYSIIALVSLIYGFKETNLDHHKEKLKFSYIKSTVGELLTSSLFMGVTACTFFSYGAFFACFVAGPVLLIKLVGISPVTYGWIGFIGGGGAYALAGFINGRLVTRLGMDTMMRIGWIIMLISAALFLIGYYTVGITLWSIVVPLILIYFGSTFIWPNAYAMAFTPFGHIAGYAGALYGSIQIAGAAVLGAVISALPDNNQLSLAGLVLVSTVLAWASYEFIVKVNKSLPQDSE